jgi:hypothetical protein
MKDINVWGVEGILSRSSVHVFHACGSLESNATKGTLHDIEREQLELDVMVFSRHQPHGWLKQ